jgi:hypothetical protein
MANKKVKRTTVEAAGGVSREDVLRLAAEARRTVGSVKAVLEGRSKPLPTQCVKEAAARLNIVLPEGI